MKERESDNYLENWIGLNAQMKVREPSFGVRAKLFAWSIC
jgi:hypothetical protein